MYIGIQNFTLRSALHPLALSVAVAMAGTGLMRISGALLSVQVMHIPALMGTRKRIMKSCFVFGRLLASIRGTMAHGWAPPRRKGEICSIDTLSVGLHSSEGMKQLRAQHNERVRRTWSSAWMVLSARSGCFQ